MIVRKSFQFRLRPTKKQAKLLQGQLDECRWLYNELLEQRKHAYEDLDVSLVNVEPQSPKEEAIGIDVGLAHFATLSNGQEIANPRFCKQGEKALAKAQRKLTLLKKGAPEMRRQGKVVAKVHEHISNQRKDFCRKESKKIIDQYQYICVEDLDIKKMVEYSRSLEA